MRDQPQVLFASSDLRQHAHSIIQDVVSRLSTWSQADLSAETLDELTQRLYNEHQIILPFLHKEQITQDHFEGVVKLYTTPRTTERKFTQLGDTMKGVIFAIEVPFDGSGRFFTMKPLNSEPTPILAHIGEQKLTLYVATFNLAPEQIQHQFNEMLDSIDRHLEWQAGTLRNFPSQFQQAVHNAINSRLAMFNRGATIASVLKFPSNLGLTRRTSRSQSSVS
jgi:hypothetical protein